MNHGLMLLLAELSAGRVRLPDGTERQAGGVDLDGLADARPELGWLAEQRDAAADDGTTLFVASTDEEDRYNSVVRQDWKLSEYRANPVVFDNHNASRVVGRATEAKVPKNGDDAGRLMIRVLWDMENPDPTIRSVGHQHRNGFRNSGSVRWSYRKVTPRDKLDPTHPAYKAREKKQVSIGDYVYEYETAGVYYEGNNLLEFSSAPLPGNASALQRSYLAAMGELDAGDVSRRLRLVGETVPRAVATDLVELARSAAPEQRAGLVDLLWPDLLERVRAEMRGLARTDTEFRRIVQAYDAAGPAPRPKPSDLHSRVAQLLAS